MIDKITCKTKIGNDIHKELIALFQELQQGWTPPLHISEEEYNNVKNNKSNYPDYYVALVGFCATFGSKYFGGYARGFKEDKTTLRDMSNEAIRNLLKQTLNIKDIQFTCKSYLDYKNIKNSMLYCDPPYQGTTGYEDYIDYDEYWNWVRKLSEDNIVLCSEYNAPDDFVKIYEKTLTTTLDKNSRKKDVEKLFIHKSRHNDIKYII